MSMVEISFSDIGNGSFEQVIIQKLDFKGISQVIILEYLQKQNIKSYKRTLRNVNVPNQGFCSVYQSHGADTIHFSSSTLQ